MNEESKKEETMKRSQKTWMTVGALLAIGISIGLCGSYFQWWGVAGALGQAGTQASTPDIRLDSSPLQSRSNGFISFADTVDRVTPSVVKISTSRRISFNSQDSPFNQLPPFFRDPFRWLPDQQQEGTGSGVVVTSNGYVLTNHHVIDQADEITVTLPGNKKVFQATLVGSDPRTDLAVLKIEADSLPAVTFGDSELLRVGDVVLAIGNPFDVGQSVTMGIISATGREVGVLQNDAYEDFIQTDASINPGNSGGALVDVQGRLIGINTAILSRSGGNQGIGFAIPSNMAQRIMSSLIEHGRVRRGFLGVFIQDVTEDLAKVFGSEKVFGALVGGVAPDGAGAAAGIQAGDIILKVNGRKIEDARKLRLMISQIEPGSRVTIELLRDGKPKTVIATLKELPDETTVSSTTTPSRDKKELLKGVVTNDLTDQLRRQFNIPEDLTGVVVTEIDPQSSAFRAGIRVGAVIRAVGRTEVANSREFGRLVNETLKSGRVLALRIWMGGGERFVVIK